MRVRLPTTSKCGSSPLARGTRPSFFQAHTLGRFIPAGAGNTRRTGGQTARCAVHPRWRGEHQKQEISRNDQTGSSPLARGTLGRRGAALGGYRFIPAGAGNTATPQASHGCNSVHPRWRGEHRSATPPSFSRTGSSPLARGTLLQGDRRAARDRFIPAGAGNTVICPTPKQPMPVHPRWRGEHPVPGVILQVLVGSSPLARGTQLIVNKHLDAQRFIPAGAGNTSSSRASPTATPVHPRWRGEHFSSQGKGSDAYGSSPLARGTHLATAKRILFGRFIPAGAGNTTWCRRRDGTVSVHPRWRGEHGR